MDTWEDRGVMVMTAAAMPTKRPRMNLVVPEDLKQDLERLAKLERRSVSNLIVYAAQRLVDEAIAEGKLEDSGKA
jgi:uncharacterized protein (DUF1778 family)